MADALIILLLVLVLWAQWKLYRQGEKNMADLSAELTALGEAIDKELQQVIDAINGGADAVATVENARATINSMTEKLNADDPSAPPAPTP